MQVGTIRADTRYTIRLYNATQSTRLPKKEKKINSLQHSHVLKKAKMLKTPKDKKRHLVVRLFSEAIAAATQLFL